MKVKQTFPIDASAEGELSYTKYVEPLTKAATQFHHRKTKQLPTRLHHYTASADAVISIIERGELWATNALFMNDSSELDYGADLARRVLQQRMKRGSKRSRLFAEAAELRVQMFHRFLDVYVVSFCADADSLSHWQAYAHRGAGYDLVFEAHPLFYHVIGAALVRVEYDRRRQIQFLNHIVTQAELFLQQDLESARGDEELVLNAFRNWNSAASFELLNLLPILKDPRFKSEREYRLVYSAPAVLPSRDVKFRSRDGDILPYVTIDMRSKGDSATLPLHSVQIIASGDDSMRRRALEKLLWHRGLHNVSVTTLNLPLRKPR